MASTGGPWGRPDIAGFTRACSTVIPFDGRNWSEFKFHFMLLCRSFALGGFLEDPAPWGNGFAFPANEPALISEYIQYSTAVYLGMLMSCTEMVKFKIKPFADGHYPAAETWKFLHKEYASEENLGQNDLIDQMQKLKLKPGQGDAYIAEKLRLRDKLYAVNYPVTRVSFNDYLVQGLPEEWHSFKTGLRSQIRTITEETMMAYIRDEDVHMQQHSNPDRMYAATAPPHRRVSTVHSSTSAAPERETLHCTFCNKTGHTAAKCWNKPPYYCPKCKTQGHTLSDCPDKGKKKSTLEELPSTGGGYSAKKDKKRRGKPKGDDQSLLMLDST